MLKFINRFKLAKRASEEGSAMIFALIVMIIALATTSLVAAFAYTNITVNQGVTAGTTFGLAADTAVNNALQLANSPNGNTLLANHIGKDNAVTGQLASGASPYTVKWSWYSERVAGTGQRIYYYIYASAYTKTASDLGAKNYRVLLSSKSVSSAAIVNGKIVYQASDQAVHQWGITGLNGITLAANAKIYSYDSFQTPTPSGTSSNAEVASNKLLTIGGGNAIKKFNEFSSDGTTNRCTGSTDCANINIENIAYALSLSSVTSKVNTVCPNAASTYPSWKASTSGGVLTTSASNQCFNTMTFDANTTIPASSSATSPTQAFIKGNIIVNAGVTVNSGNAPASLQLYSQAGTSASFASGTTTAPTRFYGLVAGESLTCASTGTTGNVYIYGGLACSTINLVAGTTLYDDDAAKLIKSTADRVLWSVSKYETL